MTERYTSYHERALELTRARGIARARDYKAAGITPAQVKRLTETGELVRLGRGLYQEPGRAGEHIAHDLAEAARAVPNGVVSLISALRYHGLTTQLPHTVWMTIPQKARTPKAGGLPLQIVRASGDVLTAGIERAWIEGVDVPIYGVAKTVADCFKHRRRVGEDIAIEGLREALRQRKASPGDIIHYAEIDRVVARVRPCLMALQ